MTQKRPHSPASSPLTTTDIYRSSQIHDRSSTFTAVYSPHLSAKDLQILPEFKDASHRIAAWRTESKQRTIFPANRTTSSTAVPQGPLVGGSSVPKMVMTMGHDDDGESYAGKRVEKVLVEQGVTGAVVVARWYGGVLLGPVRFTHIENVAREAIAKFKARGMGMDGARQEVGGVGSGGEGVKKRRVDGGDGMGDGDGTGPREVVDEVKETERLRKVLVARDGSVKVLRELLVEKKTKQERTRKEEVGKEVEPQQGHTVAEKVDQLLDSSQKNGSPAKPQMDYTTMPIQRLKQLEKARDTTIAWLLKQIDAAEEEEKQRQGDVG